MQERDAGPVVQDQSSKRACKVIVTHIKHGEFVEDCTEFLIKGVLRKFDLAHVEVAYPANFEVLVNHLEQSSRNLLCFPIIVLTVGVFRCVLDKTMSRKSAAVGTGEICLRPLVDMTLQVLVNKHTYSRALADNEGPVDAGVDFVGVVEGGVRPDSRYGARFGKSGAKIWIR